MINFHPEDVTRKKQLGEAGVNKGMLGVSLSCQKVIQYVEKGRAGMEKIQKEMRKRDDVDKKSGYFCIQALTGS